MSDHTQKLYKIEIIASLLVLYELDDGKWDREDLDGNETLVDVGGGSFELRETYVYPSGVWTEVKVLTLTPNLEDEPNVCYLSDKYYLDPSGLKVYDREGDDDDDSDDIGGDGDDFCEGEDDQNDDLRGYGGKDVIKGYGGKDRMAGGEGDDYLDGGDDDDRLSGDDGDDTMVGGRGRDMAIGGRGDDLFVDGEDSGDDHYIGQSGTDSVSYAGALAGVKVNLRTGKAGSLVGTEASVGVDKLQSIENAIGGDFDDELMGSSAANALDGGRGDDRLNGFRGIDRYTGGLGADLFVFSRASDTKLGPSADLITDFSSIEGDRIDISAIDAKKGFTRNDAFTFVDVAPSVAGETSMGVVWFQDGYLFGSTDRDSAAEFAIQVLFKDPGQTGLTADDLIL